MAFYSKLIKRHIVNRLSRHCSSTMVIDNRGYSKDNIRPNWLERIKDYHWKHWPASAQLNRTRRRGNRFLITQWINR